jgi:hypothetical protein
MSAFPKFDFESAWRDPLHSRADASETPASLAGLAALAAPLLDAEGLPCALCTACGGNVFWRLPAAHPHHRPRDWHCHVCDPVPPRTVPCDACAVPTDGELHD